MVRGRASGMDSRHFDAALGHKSLWQGWLVPGTGQAHSISPSFLTLYCPMLGATSARLLSDTPIHEASVAAS